MAIGSAWVDGAWIDAGWASGAWASGADVTAPTLSAQAEVTTGITSGSGTVTTDEPCDGYIVVTETSGTPSEAQMEAGTDSLDVAGVFENSASPDSWSVGANTISYSGLSEGTTHYVYLMGKDAANNNSNIVTYTITTGVSGEGVGPGNSQRSMFISFGRMMR